MIGPVLRIELEHIKQQMLHAFADYQGALSGQVQQQLDALLSDKGFALFVAQQVKEQFELAVAEAVKSYFRYGDGYRSINEAVKRALSGQSDASGEEG